MQKCRQDGFDLRPGDDIDGPNTQNYDQTNFGLFLPQSLNDDINVSFKLGIFYDI